MAVAGEALKAADRIILGLFVMELALRLTARGARFFREPWSVFDLAVVGLAFIPATGSLSALRALRVLRLLRLVSAVPSMRRVIEGLLRALPGMGAIAALLLLIVYIGAVIAANLFGADHPERFGSLGRAALTLFEVLTLEGWADLQREVMATHAWAWLFFVPFVIVTTLAVLNLFVAVIVEAMQSEVTEALEAEEAAVTQQLGALRAEVAALRQDLARDRA